MVTTSLSLSLWLSLFSEGEVAVPATDRGALPEKDWLAWCGSITGVLAAAVAGSDCGRAAAEGVAEGPAAEEAGSSGVMAMSSSGVMGARRVSACGVKCVSASGVMPVSSARTNLAAETPLRREVSLFREGIWGL